VASQGSNSVGGFSLSASGALAPIAGSPFPTTGTQNSGTGIVFNVAGTFVYLQDLTNVYAYSVNAASGALTLMQTIAGPSSADGIALDPHGTYLYAVGSGSNSILAYNINTSTGLLTPAPSTPMVEQQGAYTISVSPTGQSAYTIENNNDLVSYALKNGVFTPTGSVYAQVYGLKIGIDPSGSFLYVPQACGTCPSGVYNVIHEFSIGSTGALTKISGSPVAAGTTPWGIAFTTQ
jgi:DNA-binding beta-propeller fold protein YncE